RARDVLGQRAVRCAYSRAVEWALAQRVSGQLYGEPDVDGRGPSLAGGRDDPATTERGRRTRGGELMSTPSFAAIDKVIRRNWSQLRKPNVLAVRPGFKFTGGWITDKPAIVVTVNKKREKVSAQQKIAPKVGGIATDVREASPLDRLRHTDPAAHAA